jgi:hypothetical protein
LKVVGRYVGEDINGNGRGSESVVDEDESSKVVEGCRLNVVLSSIFRLFAPSPDVVPDCGKSRWTTRTSIGLKSAEQLFLLR